MDILQRAAARTALPGRTDAIFAPGPTPHHPVGMPLGVPSGIEKSGVMVDPGRSFEAM